MKYAIKKILFDRNPDGSVTYTPEDMEIIAQENDEERAQLKALIGTAYDELLNDVKLRIDGIARFADDNEECAVSINIVNNNDFTKPVQKFFRLDISLWGTKLNGRQTLYTKNELVGEWICSESSSHFFTFIKPIDK